MYMFVLLCLVCLFDLACFFLSSFSSLIKTCTCSSAGRVLCLGSSFNDVCVCLLQASREREKAVAARREVQEKLTHLEKVYMTQCMQCGVSVYCTCHSCIDTNVHVLCLCCVECQCTVHCMCHSCVNVLYLFCVNVLYLFCICSAGE